MPSSAYALRVESPSPSKMPGRPTARSTTLAHTIRQFAFFPVHSSLTIDDPHERGRIAWEQTLEALEAVAEPEDWTGHAPPGRPLPILDSYLRYTYQRLVLEGKVAVTADAGVAAINTGLLTQHAEEVFGLFHRNRLSAAQAWYFAGRPESGPRGSAQLLRASGYGRVR